MDTHYKKTAAACGLFASGILAGYVASSLSQKVKKPIAGLTQSLKRITFPRITPQIPDLNPATSSFEIENDLRLRG